MPSRNWKFRIQDILEAVAMVESYVSGMSFQDFISDQRTVDAVVRRFTIIGEASAHVPEEICRNNPGIPWEDVRAMRNIVVHEYFGVNEEILWDTIHHDLPDIVGPLKRLIE